MTPAVPNLALDDPRNEGVIRYRSGRNQKHLPPCIAPDAVEDPYMSLGSHPEIVERLWHGIAPSLPEDSRCIVFGTPALVAPRSGLVLAVAFGTQYALRLPQDAIHVAVAAGARTVMEWTGGGKTNIQQLFGTDWVFGHWLENETKWCRRVYDAAEAKAATEYGPFQPLRDLIASGCSEEDFKAMRCPKCGAALVLHVHPHRDVFSVGCYHKGGPLHFVLHGRSEGNRPTWWETFVGGAWFD